MSDVESLMRDVVITRIFERARKDKDIIFMTADFGAKALDRFRTELPDQFLHMGISEQNMIDVAGGLALCGKKVFCYAMAPFISARCYEQIKCVIASMQLPVTLIAVGVGLGYDHATLTHFTPEDLAIMKALNGIEVLTPVDAESAAQNADMALDNPGFRYLRLERLPQPNLYQGGYAENSHQGCSHFINQWAEGNAVIVACGYLVHKAVAAAKALREIGIEVGVVDLYRIKPFPAQALSEILKGYKVVISVEEQALEGGLGSSVAECMVDTNTLKPLKRLGLSDGYEVVNGSRDYLHHLYGVDTPQIVNAVKAMV